MDRQEWPVFEMSWTPPGGDRETRRFDMADVTPADDRFCHQVNGCGFIGLFDDDRGIGPGFVMTLWSVAGRQAGKPLPNPASVEQQFSMANIMGGEWEINYTTPSGDDVLDPTEPGPGPKQ